MSNGLTHPDILSMEAYGDTNTPYEPHTFFCKCGKEIENGSGTTYWHMPNGDVVCGDCIQEYKDEYFSRYRLKA